MIGSCIYHNKNAALLDTHILSRVKVTPSPDRHLPSPWEVARAWRTPQRGRVTDTQGLVAS